MPKLQYKSFKVQLKALDDAAGTVEGYGSVFNNVDLGDGRVKDRVMPGAFTRTIKNAKSAKRPALFKMLWQHDPAQVLGIWSEASEDARGLYVKGQININTELGHDVYELVKQGAIDEMSIGYDTIKSSWDPEQKGVRNLEELRLWEVSLVTFAMNPEALVTGVKGLQADTKDFAAAYEQAQALDLLDDLWLPFSCLRASLLDALNMGDQPTEDAQAALDAFNPAIIAWVEQAVKLRLNDYLNPDPDNDSGYMSAPGAQEQKEGRAFSAANMGKLAAHVDSIKSLSKQAGSIADGLATIIGQNAQDGEKQAPHASPQARVTDTHSAAPATEIKDFIAALKTFQK